MYIGVYVRKWYIVVCVGVPFKTWTKSRATTATMRVMLNQSQRKYRSAELSDRWQ